MPKSMHQPGPRSFGPQELFDFIRFQLGLENRPTTKLYTYKNKGNGLVLTPVEMDDVVTLTGGDAS